MTEKKNQMIMIMQETPRSHQTPRKAYENANERCQDLPKVKGPEEKILEGKEVEVSRMGRPWKQRFGKEK